MTMCLYSVISVYLRLSLHIHTHRYPTFFCSFAVPCHLRRYSIDFLLGGQLRQNQCHCIEGAMLAAFVLSLHGYPALMMDMRACSADDDHNITPFQAMHLIIQLLLLRELLCKLSCR